MEKTHKAKSGERMQNFHALSKISMNLHVFTDSEALQVPSLKGLYEGFITRA